jgi:4,5-dihydroxyphthalate decarboxylase
MCPITVLMQDHDFLHPLLRRDVTSRDVTFRLISDVRDLDLTDQDVVATELSFARHIKRLADGDDSWIAIPAFVQRGFTHRSWFVNRDTDFRSFSDLVGKSIGTNEWGATGNTWARAAAREQGLETSDVNWIVGSIDGERARTDDVLPLNGSYHDGQSTLSEALQQGELDALVCPDPPRCFYDQDSQVRRLLDDFQSQEREYFIRTRIFPGHHIVGVRRDKFDEDPEVARRIFDALAEVKRSWSELRLAEVDTSPWLLADLEEAMELMGNDWRPDGVEGNRAMIEQLCTELAAQGLVTRAIEPSELFRDVMLETV